MIAVACVNEQWGIGAGQELLVRIPEDKAHFKAITVGQFVVMGRKTYESLPNGALKGRTNIVLSAQKNYALPDATVYNYTDFCIFMQSYREKHTRNSIGGKQTCQFFVIGGGEIYRLLLPYCRFALITKHNFPSKEPDTFFPNLDNSAEWEEDKVYSNYFIKSPDYSFHFYERTRGLQDFSV